MDRAQSPRPVGSKSPLSGLAAASLRELFLPPSSGQVATTTWMSPASPMTTIRLQWSVHNCISSDWLCSLFAHSHPLGSECTSGGWLAAGCCSAGCLNFYWGQTKKQKQKKKRGRVGRETRENRVDGTAIGCCRTLRRRTRRNSWENFEDPELLSVKLDLKH